MPGSHYYDPSRAQYQDFDPFWEFVSGPLHAKGPSSPNQPPSAGLQFAGEVQIDGESRAMTVRIFNLAGEVLYEVGLDPAR